MLIKEIFSFLNFRFKLLYYCHLLFSLLIVLLDVFSIALIPVMIASILTDGSLSDVFNFNFFKLDSVLNNIELNYLLYLILLIFFLKNVFVYLSLYLLNNYFRDLQIHLQSNIFNKYIRKNYSFFSSKTSSEIIRNVIESQRLSNLLGSLMKLYKEALLLLFLAILLIVNTSLETIIVSSIMISILVISYFFLKGKFYNFGKLSFNSRSYIIQTLTETLNSIKLILINKNFDIFQNNFLKHLKIRVKSDTNAKNLTSLAKPSLEIMIVFILILSIIYFLNQNISIEKLISLLSLYTLVILKMTQSINTMFILSSSIRVDKILIEELKDEFKAASKKVNLKVVKKKFLPDSINSINLKNINFKYEKNSEILKNLNLEIYKNKIFAIVGKSGSGKSTLIDLITGLLKPQTGSILVNNEYDIQDYLNSWQSKIGYIPQNTFILNTSIKNNICFGLDYNKEKFLDVIQILQLNELLNREKENQNLIIGDQGGSKISGGQRQKLSLARALYKDANILILDEPTNSLDPNSSEDFLKLLQKIKSNKIIILITHDRSLIKYCDKVFDIVDSKNA